MFIPKFFDAAQSVLLRRLESVSDAIDQFGFTMADASNDEIVTEQKGVFRTNCLDWCVSPPFYSFRPEDLLI